MRLRSNSRDPLSREYPSWVSGIFPTANLKSIGKRLGDSFQYQTVDGDFPTALTFSGRGLADCFKSRKYQCEWRFAILLAAHPDLSAMGQHDGTHNGQAEPGTATGARTAGKRGKSDQSPAPDGLGDSLTHVGHTAKVTLGPSAAMAKVTVELEAA